MLQWRSPFGQQVLAQSSAIYRFWGTGCVRHKCPCIKELTLFSPQVNWLHRKNQPNPLRQSPQKRKSCTLGSVRERLTSAIPSLPRTPQPGGGRRSELTWRLGSISSALSLAAWVLRLSCTQCKTAPLPLCGRRAVVLLWIWDYECGGRGFNCSEDVVGEERERAESPWKLGVQAPSFPPVLSTIRLIWWAIFDSIPSKSPDLKREAWLTVSYIHETHTRTVWNTKRAACRDRAQVLAPSITSCVISAPSFSPL